MRGGRSSRQSLAALIVIVAAALVYATGAWRYLSLGALREHQTALRAMAAAHPAMALAAFIAVYAAYTLSSVPGATILTLAGGLIFGVWLGALATIVGATVGATAVYLLARSVFAEALTRRAERRGGVLKRLTAGFKRDAFSYLLTLRLVPAVPFWLVNIAAGVAGAPPRAYLVATVLGIVPATLIYSAVGAGLRDVFASAGRPTLASLAHPHLLLPLLGLAALSLAPVLFRRFRHAPRATPNG